MLREYEEPVEMMIELVKQDRSDRRRSDEWLSELASVCGVRGNEEEKRKGVLQRCRRVGEGGGGDEEGGAAVEESDGRDGVVFVTICTLVLVCPSLTRSRAGSPSGRPSFSA